MSHWPCISLIFSNLTEIHTKHLRAKTSNFENKSGYVQCSELLQGGLCGPLGAPNKRALPEPPAHVGTRGRPHSPSPRSVAFLRATLSNSETERKSLFTWRRLYSGKEETKTREGATPAAAGSSPLQFSVKCGFL